MDERKLTAEASALENARERELPLRGERGRLRWRDCRARAELDGRLADNVQEQRRHETRLCEAVDAAAVADRTDHDWLATHGPEAVRFLAVDREICARDGADRDAIRRLGDIQREPLERQLPTRELVLDLDSFDLEL